MKKELAPIIEEIQGQNILVIGDMVADIYLDGRISRISREAIRSIASGDTSMRARSPWTRCCR